MTKTTIVIGDLHYGEHGDSDKHNKQITEFLREVIRRHPDADQVIQLGDWYHHRSKIQVSTLNHGIEGAKLLSDAYGRENVYVLTGNHDIFFRDSLDVSSLVAIQPYVTVVDEPMSLGEWHLTPWIITQDQWDNVVAMGETHSILFAHLELNGFYMNDYHVMEGGFSPNELRDYNLVLTGHYHSQQKKGNIQYTGTPIPMSQNEANRDMGYFILRGNEPEFQLYDRVKVLSVPFDQLDDVIASCDDPFNTSIRVEFPDELEDESIVEEVMDALLELNFADVKAKYKGSAEKKLIATQVDSIQEIDDIDEKVLGFIKDSATETTGVDKSRLERMYNLAKEKETHDQLESN